jgi:tRNA threonylcarbamoyladenosine biosynthesis protein TsaE
MYYESQSFGDTMKIGEELGAQAKAGDVYCLTGDLGAGKTVFSKGFGKGMGVAEEIVSPTFTIINEYAGRLPLYHMDVYRLTSEEDAEDAGVPDCFYAGGVCLVEWGEKIRGLLPGDTCWINIKKDLSRGTDYRKITIGSNNI